MGRTASIVLLTFAISLPFAFCGGLGTWLVLSARDRAQQITDNAISRNVFRGALLGKSQADVVAAIGRPDDTQEYGKEPTWYYRNRTYDPITGKIDSLTQVVFRDGVVVRVNY